MNRIIDGGGCIRILHDYSTCPHTKKSGFEKVLKAANFFEKTIAALIACSHCSNSVAYQRVIVASIYSVNEGSVLLVLNRVLNCLQKLSILID